MLDGRDRRTDWAMGNACCGAGDGDLRRRRALLREGGEFKKKSAFLGVLSRSERVHVQLNETDTRCVTRGGVMSVPYGS